MSEAVSKYRAKKTEYNGEIYDSKAEARFAATLELMKKAKGDAKMVAIQRQYVFQIELNGKKICKYIADFACTFADGRQLFYDVKGFATPVYKLKKKLVEAQYGIQIIEIKYP